MPSYDYRCEECKAEFTVDRSMKDESQQHCTGCGSAKANRIWNVFVSLSSGSTADYGQAAAPSSGGARKSGCGSCSSSACGTCH